MTTKLKLVSYIRVSTKRQGDSGLGLEGQQEAIRAYGLRVDGELIHEYREVESGKNNDRPELAKAMAHAKRIQGRLVIAKLDRLTRNARFLLGIVEAGADVAFCELPQMPDGPMGKFFLTMMAAVAELERGLISQRTRAALKAYKDGGKVSERIKLLYPEGVPDEVRAATAGKLGAHLAQCRDNLTQAGRTKGARASGRVAKEKADTSYDDLLPLMRTLKEQGLSGRKIAGQLNAEGKTTRNGKPWNQVQVMRVLKRFTAGA